MQNDFRTGDVLTVLALVHYNPNISSRQIEREIRIPYRTVLRILKARKYHAYYITVTQALTPADMQGRIQF